MHQLSSKFREAARIVTAPLPAGGPAPGELLLRRVSVGVNASDINFTSGRYYGGSTAQSYNQPLLESF